MPIIICPMRKAREVSALCKSVRINPNAINIQARKPFIEYLMSELGRGERGLISSTN